MEKKKKAIIKHVNTSIEQENRQNETRIKENVLIKKSIYR